ncbi:MAG: alginate O-acetyltransferase [Phycisphaerae bacterium]|nr:MAG: alginate O-acetyltransferase [Phycisphaerae bacterium]
MIFPSYIFILAFLPIMLSGWYLIRSYRLKLAFLTAMSYVFYGWLDYRFVALMLASTLLDYCCGQKIAQAHAPIVRKRWLICSIAGNLSSLGFFKYYGFFSQSCADMLAVIGVDASLPVLNVVLPLGISFYTFQSMSYTIDIYRGRCQPTGDLLLFTAYVSMFPQLVAGPIVRYSDIEKQLATLRNQATNHEQICDGAWLFVIGLIKKIWIADVMAPVVAHAFDSETSPQFVTSWVGTICYTFQIYFDFSAYSDMARGLGLMMGFRFPVNFNSPYKSSSISEFWNRWHITLSHWLRDYLYIPLGGSRHGTSKTLRNLGITMFLGGLWHGAAWNFVVWGLFHGGLLMVHATWKRFSTVQLNRTLAICVTFMCVMFGWVFFRANSLEGAVSILSGMVGLHGIEPFTHLSSTLGVSLPGIYHQFSGMHGLAYLAFVGILTFWAPNSEEIPRFRQPVVGMALGTVAVCTLTTFMEETPFLYFMF